jgi:hypothetical protein
LVTFIQPEYITYSHPIKGSNSRITISRTNAISHDGQAHDLPVKESVLQSNKISNIGAAHDIPFKESVLQPNEISNIGSAFDESIIFTIG